jgi:hypothetical protein
MDHRCVQNAGSCRMKAPVVRAGPEKQLQTVKTGYQPGAP